MRYQYMLKDPVVAQISGALNKHVVVVVPKTQEIIILDHSSKVSFIHLFYRKSEEFADRISMHEKFCKPRYLIPLYNQPESVARSLLTWMLFDHLLMHVLREYTSVMYAYSKFPVWL